MSQQLMGLFGLTHKPYHTCMHTHHICAHVYMRHYIFIYEYVCLYLMQSSNIVL